MSYHEWAALLSIAVTFAAYGPYVVAIHRGRTRPHVFSWLIWMLSTSVVFLAQLSAAGGAGAWPTGVSAVITLYVTWLAWQRQGDLSITRSDRAFLVAALASLPVWYFTANPLWSVVILSTVDVLGFGPTLRKAWWRPYEESMLFFSLFTVRSALAIVALESRNLTTLLFPVVVLLTCAALCLLLWWRRRRCQPEPGLNPPRAAPDS